MSAYDFIINMDQEGRLGTHEEQIAELRVIVSNLHMRISYLETELERNRLHQGEGKYSDIVSDGGMDPRK